MKLAFVCACAAMGLVSSPLVAAPLPPPTVPAHLRSDREIQEAVVKGLLANPEVMAADVHVRVAARVVVLEGYVRSAAARKMAEKVARSVPGVLRVKNELAVRQPPA